MSLITSTQRRGLMGPTLHELRAARPKLCVRCSQVDMTLPSAGDGKRWSRVVDTNLPSPKDFTPGGNAGVDAKYGVESYSSIMLIAK